MFASLGIAQRMLALAVVLCVMVLKVAAVTFTPLWTCSNATPNTTAIMLTAAAAAWASLHAHSITAAQRLAVLNKAVLPEFPQRLLAIKRRTRDEPVLGICRLRVRMQRRFTKKLLRKLRRRLARCVVTP
jgi:hypothetical protein